MLSVRHMPTRGLGLAKARKLLSERGLIPGSKIPNGRTPRVGERERTAWLYAAEIETLRMINQGASLTDTLTHVCASIDRLIFPSVTTILLMDPDGLRLRPAAGPQIPQEWMSAISSVRVDPCAGLCNTAAALKKRVIVPDVANEPVWL